MNTRLKKIVTEFRRGMLGRRRSRGMCWLVSQPLAAYLRVMGHECKAIEGLVGEEVPKHCHVWIEMADGTCVDVTADQFSTKERPMPKVYIGPRPKWYRAVSHAELTSTIRAIEAVKKSKTKSVPHARQARKG